LAIGPFRRLTSGHCGPKLCLPPQPHRVRHELRPPALATPARHPGSGRHRGRRIAPSLHPRRVGSFPYITPGPYCFDPGGRGGFRDPQALLASILSADEVFGTYRPFWRRSCRPTRFSGPTGASPPLPSVRGRQPLLLPGSDFRLRDDEGVVVDGVGSNYSAQLQLPRRPRLAAPRPPAR
jgi:hypothetical protein